MPFHNTIDTFIVGAFGAMDLDGNGQISRDEWLECNVGFFYSIEEERYNHFFGLIEY